MSSTLLSYSGFESKFFFVFDFSCLSLITRFTAFVGVFDGDLSGFVSSSFLGVASDVVGRKLIWVEKNVNHGLCQECQNVGYQTHNVYININMTKNLYKAKILH